MPRSQSSKNPITPRVINPLSSVGSNHHLSHQSSYTPSQSSQGFFSSMKEGIALGAGSSIGNRIVTSIFGPPSVSVDSKNHTQPSYTSPQACNSLQTTFNTCLQEKKPLEECQRALQDLHKCIDQESRR